MEQRNVGGAPTKLAIVQEWRRSNPDGSKSACARGTGLSRTTVCKWWNSADVLSTADELAAMQGELNAARNVNRELCKELEESRETIKQLKTRKLLARILNL